MKKFVQISNSTPTHIRVLPGIYSIDATNKYSPTKDRLNVKPAWTNMAVEIVPGVGWYPAEIAKWDDVKALAKKNVFTIGLETDGEGMPEEWIEKASASVEKLHKAMSKYTADVQKAEEIKKADKFRENAEV